VVTRWRKTDSTSRAPRSTRTFSESLKEDASPVTQASHTLPAAAKTSEPATAGSSERLNLLPAAPTEAFDAPDAPVRIARKRSAPSAPEGNAVVAANWSERNQNPQDPPSLPPIVPNPFPRKQDVPSESPSDTLLAPIQPPARSYDLPPAPPPRSERSAVNCDEVRTFANGLDIRTVRIDSSPSFVEGTSPNLDSQIVNTKENFIAKAPTRTWRSINGQEIATGRLVDLVFGTAIIETEEGERVSYLLRRLSDPDQVYVAESWGIPVTCSLGDQPIEARGFTETTLTWKASGACHKPLYFEEVQLERYGHEWGPVVQPALSTVTFFGNLAFLPYKMGIHPPNECQHPLGYYRPGSCAPWTVGPVPISLRGAMVQAGVVTGLAGALP